MTAYSKISTLAMVGILLLLNACGSGLPHTPAPPRVVQLTEQQMKAIMLSPSQVKTEFPDLIFLDEESGPLPILLTNNPSIEVRNYQTPTPIPNWQSGYAHSFHSFFFFPSDADDAVFSVVSQIDVLNSSEAAASFINISIAEHMERLSVQPSNTDVHSIETLTASEGIGEAFGGHRARVDIPGQGLYLRSYQWYWKRWNVVLSVYLQGREQTDHGPTVARLAGEIDARFVAVVGQQ